MMSRQVVGLDARPRAPRSTRRRRRRRRGEEVGPRRRCPSGAGPRSTTISSSVGRLARRVEQRDVVGVEEVGDGEEQPGAGGARGRTAASSPLKRVLSGTSTAPARWTPSAAIDPLADVRRPDRHPVAGLDARGDRAPGPPRRPPPPARRTSQAQVAVDQGLARRRTAPPPARSRCGMVDGCVGFGRASAAGISSNPGVRTALICLRSSTHVCDRSPSGQLNPGSNHRIGFNGLPEHVERQGEHDE